MLYLIINLHVVVVFDCTVNAVVIACVNIIGRNG